MHENTAQLRIKPQLAEIFALNNWAEIYFTEVFMNTNKTIPENLIVVHSFL